MSDPLPCQEGFYLHRMVGGPQDGEVLPAGRFHRSLTWESADGNRHRYAWDGEEPEDYDPVRHTGGRVWAAVFTDTSAYREAKFLTARLVYSGLVEGGRRG